ncbi:Cell invasion protein SipD [Pandoraea iniqua]|uniref:IpaD/SipD/SspD family type III secretion system needle tip protein n=1 Tax=Pandoraea iniqua TaxID=2508288 RepID=UPI001241F572|nr:IpaD/SipD/SspD family type III secretion system needle tip protein [Pandoraea iniqua]VVD64567.1 Cell invasion protein SipD [Pandoraea iniqua]
MSETVNVTYRPIPVPQRIDPPALETLETLDRLDTRSPGAPFIPEPDTEPDDSLAGDVVLLAGALQAVGHLSDRLRALDREIRVQSPTQATRDAAAVGAYDLSRRLRGLAAIDVPITDQVRDDVVKATRRGVPGLRGNPDPEAQGNPKLQGAPDVRSESPSPETGNPPPAADDTSMSNAELWQQIAEMIGKMKDDYLTVYGDAADKYLKFNDAISKIVAKLSTWIKADDKGEKVTLDVAALKAALEEAKAAFELPNPAAVLFPPQDKDATGIEGASKEAAEKWLKDLGLPERSLKEQPAGSGKYVVVIDTAPLDRMIENVPASGVMNPFELDIWRSGFTSQENLIKTSMQSLMQRYSTANSVYDNLVKILSATINATLEVCKGYLR